MRKKSGVVRGLSDRLRSARQAAGLTQIQAGKKSGVHQVSISQFELGKHTPTIPTLCKLAEPYGFDVCDLLRDESKLGTRSVPQKEAEPAPFKKPQRVCLVCSQLFMAPRSDAVYCSSRCAASASTARRKKRRADKRQFVCPVCSEPFQAARSDAKYCSSVCKLAAYRSTEDQR